MVRKLVPDIVSGQDIFTLGRDATVRDAAQGMTTRNVASVLVTDSGRLLGIFTGTDLIRKVVAPGLDPDRTPLGEVMTRDPVTIDARANALEALHCMHDGRFHHLPVVDGGTLVGIVSRRDFLGFEEDEVEHQEKLWEEM
jgi:CBS domain-containing protein